MTVHRPIMALPGGQTITLAGINPVLLPQGRPTK